MGTSLVNLSSLASSSSDTGYKGYILGNSDLTSNTTGNAYIDNITEYTSGVWFIASSSGSLIVDDGTIPVVIGDHILINKDVAKLSILVADVSINQATGGNVNAVGTLTADKLVEGDGGTNIKASTISPADVAVLRGDVAPNISMTGQFGATGNVYIDNIDNNTGSYKAGDLFRASSTGDIYFAGFTTLKVIAGQYILITNAVLKSAILPTDVFIISAPLVTSVFGRVGAITADKGDYTAEKITIGNSQGAIIISSKTNGMIANNKVIFDTVSDTLNIDGNLLIGKFVGWDVSTALLQVGNSFDADPYTGNPKCIQMKPDGTKIYISDVTGNKLYEFTLLIAEDLNSVDVNNIKSADISAQAPFINSFFITEDGSKFLPVGTQIDHVYRYDFVTPWTLADGLTFIQNTSIASQDTNPRGIWYNSTGTQMRLMGITNNLVHQYTLSTPYDLTTLVYDNISFAPSETATTLDMICTPDGTKMYFSSYGNNKIIAYNVPDVADISTSTYTGEFFSPAITNFISLTINQNGSTMFLLDENDTVTSYTMSTSMQVGTEIIEKGFIKTQDIQLESSITTPFGGLSQYENLLRYSEDFSVGAVWNTNPAVIIVTANNIISPNGQMNADTVQWLSSENIRQFNVGISLGSTYIFSMWGRHVSGTSGQLLIDAADGSSQVMEFTSGSWTRQEVTLVGGVSGDFLDIYHTGTDTFEFWGAQLTNGTKSLSYAKTTDTPVLLDYGLVVNDNQLVIGNSKYKRATGEHVQFSTNTSTSLLGDVSTYECTDLSVARTFTISDSSVLLGTPQYPYKFIVKDISGNAGTNNLTIIRETGLIQGQVNIIISVDYGDLILYSNGTDIYTLGD